MSSTPVRAGVLVAPWHARSVAEVAAALGTDPARGLARAAHAVRLAETGPNTLPAPAGPPWFARLLRPFANTLMVLLLAAAGVTLWLRETVDAVAIIGIMLLNAGLSIVQEVRAERSVAALQAMAAPMARVLRGGGATTRPSAELVPGDVIELESGDHVPADARLVETSEFRTQESALTGESTPVAKHAAARLAEDCALGDRANMVFVGTIVTTGRARAIVTGTGRATELGAIAALLERIDRGETPLQMRLSAFGRVLASACVGIVIAVGATYLARGMPVLDVMLIAVSLAVAAVPEGLPAVVAIVLSIGVQRMARRNALVRRLASVEALGSVDVICSDKTGTLTRNEMTVREIHVAGAVVRVEGAGNSAEGRFSIRAETGRAPGEPPWRTVPPAEVRGLLPLLRSGALCTNARFARDPEGAGIDVDGDPTETALIVAALKAGFEPDARRHVRVFEIPFEAERRLMTTAVREPDARVTLHVKGAPETVLALCTRELTPDGSVPLGADRVADILGAAAAMSARALRVLAIASRAGDGVTPDEAERDLTLLGLAGMMDPPRAEAAESVRACRAAGIRPVMITGDHPDTALAIAREVGITGETGGVLTGARLETMSDAELKEAIGNVDVVARATAGHKLRIVEALHARGSVLAMTGDGVNDAPALRAADIGIAMGRTGTDATRAAADLILLDDNFATIVAAVEEGRRILDNIRKFVRYLLSTNAGELLLMLAAAILGWPLPLVAVQILWINLVTDGLPALALGLEPAEAGLMRRGPDGRERRLLPAREWLGILGTGALVATTAGAMFWWALARNPEDVAHARVIAFSVIAFAQLSLAVAFRNPARTLPEIGVFGNRPLLFALGLAALLQVAIVELAPLRPFFAVARPVASDWLALIPAALFPVTVIEVGKIVRARFWKPGRSGSPPPEPIRVES
jgi:Ca2+-transporting ATPase